MARRYFRRRFAGPHIPAITGPITDPTTENVLTSVASVEKMIRAGYCGGALTALYNATRFTGHAEREGYVDEERVTRALSGAYYLFRDKCIRKRGVPHRVSPKAKRKAKRKVQMYREELRRRRYGR